MTVSGKCSLSAPDQSNKQRTDTLNLRYTQLTPVPQQESRYDVSLTTAWTAYTPSVTTPYIWQIACTGANDIDVARDISSVKQLINAAKPGLPTQFNLQTAVLYFRSAAGTSSMNIRVLSE